jgi:hypothetical protein
MKKLLFSLVSLALLFVNLSSAQADPTYAVLDSNGNVTNIIVCGNACASGEFAGNKVVLQIAADTVTGENRGGIWNGEGTTTYSENNNTFTVMPSSGQLVEYTNNSIETTLSTTPLATEIITNTNENGVEVETVANIEKRDIVKTTSSINIFGELTSFSFTYEDTIGSNLFTKHKFVRNWSNNSQSTIFVDVEKNTTTAKVINGVDNVLSQVKENNIESMSFDNKKTTQEIQDSIINSNLYLLNSKIQTLISLLGSWVK